MTQSLEAVNAYDKAQSEVKRRRKKTQKFVNNVAWNEIICAMFSGASVIDLAIKYGVSDKTIYKWRKHVIDGTIQDRYHLTNETIEVVKGSEMMFRDDGAMKPWNPNQPYLERLRELNRMEEQLAFNPPIEDTTPKEQPMTVENLLNRLEKTQDQPLAETSTLLQAPNGDRLITEVNDAQLLKFLKNQGFWVYKIILDKI